MILVNRVRKYIKWRILERFAFPLQRPDTMGTSLPSLPPVMSTEALSQAQSHLDDKHEYER